MTEDQKISEITGYISIPEAARRLGVADSRVYAYIDDGRLDILTVAHVTVVSEESVKRFKLKSAAGRPRTKAPTWRESPSTGTFLITLIAVRICEGQQGKFELRLREMRKQQEHLFPGTVARYIAMDDISPSTIEIQLIWKQSEMPGEKEFQKALEAFKQAFVDVLDWDTARYRTKTVLLHT